VLDDAKSQFALWYCNMASLPQTLMILSIYDASGTTSGRNPGPPRGASRGPDRTIHYLIQIVTHQPETSVHGAFRMHATMVSALRLGTTK
jgi:hypothetical protein